MAAQLLSVVTEEAITASRFFIMGDTVRRFLLYVARRWMCLTCSTIVLHVSSVLYIVPTNIYSCHSSTVCIDSTCMVSWNYSVEYVHGDSVQFVCVLGEGGRVVFVSGRV